MGIMGRYIDLLPDEARDRLIQAQEWCLAEVVGPGGARCLVGHAEDWHPLAVEGSWWQAAEGGMPPGGDAAGAELEMACSPAVFAFRRARPADLAVYRERVRRWGLASEAGIGSRFDRLCTRRGTAGATRLVKARAARASAPASPPRAAAPVRAWQPAARSVPSDGVPDPARVG